MSDLKLDSLRIQNFRTFRDLTIDRLGRVNLIVGKNNVGKTALLEALWVWGHPEFWRDLVSFLADEYQDWKTLREEGSSRREPEREILKKRYQVLSQYFHGFPSINEADGFEVKVGPTDQSQRTNTVEFWTLKKHGEHQEVPVPRIEVWPGPQMEMSPIKKEASMATSLADPSTTHEPLENDNFPVTFVASDGISPEEAGRFWDEAIRSGKKDRVLRALNVVFRAKSPIEDLNLLEVPSLKTEFSGDTLRRGFGTTETRSPVVTLDERKEPVPLSTFGEGAHRAFWVGSSLVNSKDGLLLIDEVENGLHYSIQSDLWQMIFEMAQELDVQVFATTHSYDCVQAFEQVAQDYECSESMLVSLRRREKDPEDIVAVLSDRDELGTVVEENIEVR
jgi:hypothetical protein